MSGAYLTDSDRQVMKKIEAVFLQFVEQVVAGKEPNLKFADTNPGADCPLHRRNQLKKFGLTAYMLEYIYNKLIRQGDFTTKRDIYYQQKGTIFYSQRAVDRTISACCNILNEKRINLHIISTAKGIVFGDLILKDQKGEEIFECRRNQNGTTIPNHVEDGTVVVSQAKYILLVEKDATFQRLLTEKITEIEDFPCIVVTGKGYPDISTRFFVRKISEELKLKVFCLTDSGAHGVEIMLTYKYGPKVRSVESDNAETPNMEWVGVKPTELFCLSIEPQFLQDMDERELRKIPRLLDRTCLKMEEEAELKRELEFLLVKQKKGEIQNVSSINPKYLTRTYLMPRIQSSLARDAAKSALEGAKKIAEE